MAMTLDGSNGVTFNDASLQGAAASPYVLKNRIINGDMRIDQRNAGASVTPSGDPVYTLDRWYITQSQNSKFTIQQNAGSVTPPSGYKNYLGATVVSAVTVGASDYFSLAQSIEGFNIADLNWGTANAQTVTLSFWVRSSLTGTFGGALRNTTGNLSYPFTYTISSANTWEQKSVTIGGSTTGTWNSTNTEGVIVRFGLGAGSTFSGTSGAWATQNSMSATGATSVVGTNGATFYITGVQLEIGTSATPFERRLYNQELANCQRYYQLVEGGPFGSVTSTVYYGGVVGYLQQMRATPTPTWIQTISAYGFPTTASTAISATVRSFVIYKAANASLGGCYFQDQFSLAAEL